MRRPLIVLIVLLAALPASADGIGQPGSTESASTASPTDRLNEARAAFAKQDYNRAVEKLSALLFPNEQLALPGDLVEAYLLLGASYVATGRPGEAKDAFKQVLRLEPNKTLDATYFSASTIRIFDETKSEVDEERRKIEEQRKIEALKKAQEDYLKSLRPIEIHPLWEIFVPFGGAQLLQHRTGWGIGFASAQGVTAVTSASIFFYIASTYGFGANVHLSHDQAQTVNSLEEIEIGSAVAFYVFYVAGLYDAFHHYQPRIQIQGDPSLLPPELRTQPKKQSLLDRIHVFPMATAHGAGLGIGWEN